MIPGFAKRGPHPPRTRLPWLAASKFPRHSKAMAGACRTLLILLLGLAGPAAGQDAQAIRAHDRREIAIERAAPASHRLTLALAYFEGAWDPMQIESAVREGAQILAQCGVAVERAELARIEAPERYRKFHTPASRELARALALATPAVFFVAGTLQRPAFDAEAIGRGNSRTRPELRDTVWIARGARDTGIVLAHELVHVLADSGRHSDEPGNLMREDTAAGDTHLTPAQCARIRDTGASNGLLEALRGP